MKKVLLALFLSLIFTISSYSQIPSKALDLSNSLSDLWHNGETEKAVQSALELQMLYIPFLIDNIHDILAQQLARNEDQYSLQFLEKLYQEGDQNIKAIVYPILLWAQAQAANSDEELSTIKKKLKELQDTHFNMRSKLPRYNLLVLNELDKKNSLEKKYQREIVEGSIEKLKDLPSSIKVNSVDMVIPEKMAWKRYLIAYYYYYFYSHIDDKEEYLKLASDYSPNLIDIFNSSAYFYDAAVLTGNVDQIGFKSEYLSYLAEHNRTEEALNLLSEITFNDPSDKNINELKELFTTVNKSKAFDLYWQDYIHKKGKAVPDIKIEFENETLDLGKKHDNWIYIDVWGTWCIPCIKELPELQNFYSKNKDSKGAKLKIYTFSFASQDLDKFMVNKKYTFPVSEIDQETNELFEISGYPTKILISPEGNYIKIPYGVDWITSIKNYTLAN